MIEIAERKYFDKKGQNSKKKRKKNKLTILKLRKNLII